MIFWLEKNGVKLPVFVCLRRDGNCIFFYFILSVVCQAMSQSSLDNIAASLDLRFELLSNFAAGSKIRLTFTNKGLRVIKSGKWAIYFTSPRKFNQRTTSSIEFDPKTKFTVTHIDGYLHKLKPTDYFSDLLPGKDFQFYLSNQNAIVSRTDVMPNWYIAARGLEPRIILSTKGESLKFVGPFDTPAKWKRSPGDAYDPFTPEKRFQMNNIADLKRVGNLIIPTPLVLNVLHPTETMSLSRGKWNIVAQRGLESEGRYLAGKWAVKPFVSYRQVDK